MLFNVSDLERIGDHAENIAEYASQKGNRRKDMHSASRDYLHVLSDTVLQMTALVLELLSSYAKEEPDPEQNDYNLVQVEALEGQVDNLARECIEKYIKRQKEKTRDPRGGIILTGIVSDLERTADLTLNIARR